MTDRKSGRLRSSEAREFIRVRLHNLDTVEKFAEITARVSHNHPEGIKGAQATAAAVFMARTGSTKDEIKA